MKYLTLIFLIIFGMLDAMAADIDITKADTVVVEVKGTDVDARFDPAVVQVNAGDVIQFIVREGWHTVTAYHPENRRPNRIPESAKPFDSGLLEKGDEWLLKVNEEGIYDYFCLPHEKMGHVGRIIVGSADSLTYYSDERMIPIVVQKLEESTKKFLNQ